MSPLTQSLLDKRPEQSLFVIYIIYQIPARWRMFGIHLDIKVNRLDAISEKDPEECFLKVYSSPTTFCSSLRLFHSILVPSTDPETKLQVTIIRYEQQICSHLLSNTSCTLGSLLMTPPHNMSSTSMTSCLSQILMESQQ